MFANEKSGVAVMQYVEDGSVFLSVDAIALDTAAAASVVDGTLAPHAIAKSGEVAASTSTAARVECRASDRLMLLTATRPAAARRSARTRRRRSPSRSPKRGARETTG